MTPIVTLVLRAHGHRTPGPGPMRRVVMRMPVEDVARIDALRPRLKATRAALIRAFCLVGLAMAEEQALEVPTTPEGEP